MPAARLDSELPTPGVEDERREKHRLLAAPNLPGAPTWR
jgi:hypothetical protein